MQKQVMISIGGKKNAKTDGWGVKKRKRKSNIIKIYDEIYVEDLATAEGRERSGQAGARGRPALHLARFVS